MKETVSLPSSRPRATPLAGTMRASSRRPGAERCGSTSTVARATSSTAAAIPTGNRQDLRMPQHNRGGSSGAPRLRLVVHHRQGSSGRGLHDVAILEREVLPAITVDARARLREVQRQEIVDDALDARRVVAVHAYAGAAFGQQVEQR